MIQYFIIIMWHYAIILASDWSGLCTELEVVDITFQEPGDVDIWNKKASMEDIPYYFAGTHSLSGAPITFNADKNIELAVFFTIGPVDSDGNPILDPAAIIDNGAVYQ